MKQNKRKKSWFRIHQIYEFREDFLYDNPMNIYLIHNKKKAIISFINANIEDITLLPRKLHRNVFGRKIINNVLANSIS
jgi:hypothetical protein